MDIPAPADPVGTSDAAEKPTASPPKKATATQFFIKGLAIVLPPILTLVILVWIGQIIYGYVVSPVTTSVRFVIAEIIDKSRPTNQFETAPGLPPLEYCGNDYRLPPEVARQYENDLEAGRKKNGESKASLAEEAYVPFGERSVPYADFWEVASRMRPADWPATATGLYMELVTFRYFKSLGSLSALATALTIIGLYFMGRFVTARMGQWLISRFESLVLARVPIISSIYSSVKQVTDFFFTERAVAYNRVVAIEFPRRGIWTIGFAMGESLMEMTLAAGEPMVSIMIPAAPMPMSGWVVTVPKSAIIDLNMTLDQAFQYFLSCGVLVPEHQRATPEVLHRELSRRLASTFGTPGALGQQSPFAESRPPYNPGPYEESRPPFAPFDGRPSGAVPPNVSPGGPSPAPLPPGSPPRDDEAQPS
ncbi:MAG TPA: DUF502 domain-containing protein [Planctomycetaceae bacterium]|jgi:uncharacterized membrane protein|nr:DUF502 domain-containing protein [Planctomycetaceae bacterium]